MLFSDYQRLIVWSADTRHSSSLYAFYRENTAFMPGAHRTPDSFTNTVLPSPATTSAEVPMTSATNCSYLSASVGGR